MKADKIVKKQIVNLPVYETGKPIEYVAREFGLDPDGILKMASNENPLGASPKAVEAVKNHLGGLNYYPDGGCYELRQKLSKKWGLAPSQFAFGNGSNEILEFVAQCFVGEGDETVFGAQSFIVYKLATIFMGGVCKSVPMPGMKYDLDAMREAVRYERRVEFPVEAVNFFDEVRWGTYKETKSPGLRRGGVHTPEPADNPEGRQPETKPFHIMVVEATPDLREFLVKNFEDTYGVLSAKNGAEALAILEKQACDLIISDALMPEMDGFDLLMKVRNDEMLCHIPFILLSVVDSVDSKIKGLEYGADVYIEKPFSLGYVKATVESLLENRKRAFRHFASRPGFQYEKDDMGRNDRQWLDKLTGIVRENLTCETLSVDLLTEKMALSRSSLQRKLKGLTGVSPNEYIQLVRLKTAAQLLRSGEYRISEVCYQTGFSSMSWFAKCFTKQFGMRPKDFIRQNQDGKSSG